MLKNVGPFLILLLFVSCGEKKSLRLGETTKAALIEMKGEPESSKEIPGGEILSYKGNENFQVNGEKVTASFRDPGGDEKTVLFWRHAFRDCETSEKKLSDDDHPEIELDCATEGRSVVFVEGSGTVIRVSEHERN